MPSYRDVRVQLDGLLLLIQGDARGLQRFDISDAGVLRSFSAITWCAPAILVGWTFHRIEYLREHPHGGGGLLAFVVKMAVIEAAQWIVPALLLAALAIALQFRPLLRTLIVARNWFAVPLAYATSMIVTPVRFLSDVREGVSAFTTYSSVALSLAILVGALVLGWRLLITIVGGSPRIRAAILFALVVCQFFFISELESMLGVHTA